MQHLAAHVGGLVAGQKHEAGGDFVGLTGPMRGGGAAVSGCTFRAERGRNERVQIGPGATAFTRMFCSIKLCDSERVSATMAPLVAE